MSKAYSYIRFSTPEQIKGDSLRRQIEASEQYAVEHKLELDTSLTFRDLGVSAFNHQNIAKGALGEFLNLVQSGRIKAGSTLLVENLDRLSRGEILDALDLFLSLIRSGITIVTLMDRAIHNRDSINSNVGQLFVTIGTMLRAADESATKSKRIRASWDNKRKKIKEKRLTKRSPYWLKPAVGSRGFEVIPERAEIVKKIFAMAKNGYGNSLITKTLNEEGVKPFSPKTEGWQPSYIQKLLRNEAVFGVFRLHTQRDGEIKEVGEPIIDYYPAIISKEEWLLVNSIRVNRTTRGGASKGKHVSNIFSGLLFCGHCEGTMNMAAHTKKKSNGEAKITKYVACSRARRGLGCLHIAWNYAELESEVLAFCETLDFKTILSETVSTPSEIETTQKNLLKVSASIRENEEKLNRLLNSIESATTDAPASLVERIRSIDLEQKVLKEEEESVKIVLSALEADVDRGSETASQVSEILKNLRNLDGRELKELRLKLATQLRRTINKILLFPAGPWIDPKRQDSMRENLKKAGYTSHRIKQYEESVSVPRKDKRRLVISFQNGEAISIEPTHTQRFIRLPKGGDIIISRR